MHFGESKDFLKKCLFFCHLFALQFVINNEGGKNLSAVPKFMGCGRKKLNLRAWIYNQARKEKHMKKIVSVLLAMAIGFFSALSLDVQTEALTDTGNISQTYWGNYYNQTDSTFLIAITGGRSISFRGIHRSVTMSANSPKTIYFSPNATGTSNNFIVEFNNWARLIGNSFVSQAGTQEIGAYYNNSTDQIKMDIGAGYHYYEKD